MIFHRTLNPDQAVAVSLPPSKAPQTVTVCAGPEGYRQNTVEVIAPHGTRIRVVRRDTGQVVSQIPHEPSDEG